MRSVVLTKRKELNSGQRSRDPHRPDHWPIRAAWSDSMVNKCFFLFFFFFNFFGFFLNWLSSYANELFIGGPFRCLVRWKHRVKPLSSHFQAIGKPFTRIVGGILGSLGFFGHIQGIFFWGGVLAILWLISRDSLGSLGFFEHFQGILKGFLGFFWDPWDFFWPFWKDSEWF